ncbi:PucR family transcriptional regulator [Alteribacillus sp. JSM 102045]|uniref:PucR family transcriptional regulator n=1 Tax=Alteribacillus sp. JSM 102045 TaxID=1562101 RepID=UPI0035BF9B95
MPTLKQVLELDILSHAKVKTASHKVSELVVEWASIMDIPVENFIRDNELVLNTGSGSGHDMEIFFEFVKSVYEAGASALAIAKGQYITEIPKSVIAFGEEKEFPIIEIPWEIRFGDIVHSVISEIKHVKNKEMLRTEDIQQQLLDIMLSSPPLSKIAEFMEEKLNYPLIIVDNKGSILGKSQNARDLAEKWNSHRVTNNVSLQSQELFFKNKQHPLHTRIKKLQIFNITILQTPIESSHSIQGYLNISFKEERTANDFLETSNMVLLEHSSAILAMWFLRENAIEETKMRLRGDFVWNLASDDYLNIDDKLSQAQSLGYNLDLPYICIIGKPENLFELYKRNNPDTSYDLWKESMIHYIQDEIFLTARMVNRKVMTTPYRNDIILFIEFYRDDSKEKLHEFLELLNRRLNNLMPAVLMSWGIGRFHNNEKMFSGSFRDAKTALKIGRKTDGHGCRINYEDTKMERALIRISKDEEMREIVSSTLSALADYDKQKNLNLMETLDVYIENQGKISQTARQLHLHRHTLLYRLRKVESLTNLSMLHPSDRFLMELSINLWRLNEI